jgi:hypothetical protein
VKTENVDGRDSVDLTTHPRIADESKKSATGSDGEDHPGADRPRRRWGLRLDDAVWGWLERGFNRLTAGRPLLRSILVGVIGVVAAAAYLLSQ